MKIQEFDQASCKYEDLDNSDEAEALVTAYPNSSKAWILYMVFCLKQGEVNKARRVVQRGIQSVNFRNDHEKLNLWKALLNLEIHHGTKDSLDKVLKDALVYNDQETIYNHMLDVYISLDNEEEVENLSQIFFKKFKHNKDMWIKFITYYMQHGKHKEARNTYQRSLQCISTKEHADLQSKYAHLEYKHGEIERSLIMYEEILVKYPKRKDIKSTFISILKNIGQHDRAEVLINCT